MLGEASSFALHPEFLQSDESEKNLHWDLWQLCCLKSVFQPYAYLSDGPLSFGVICPLSFIKSFTMRPACEQTINIRSTHSWHFKLNFSLLRKDCQNKKIKTFTTDINYNSTLATIPVAKYFLKQCWTTWMVTILPALYAQWSSFCFHHCVSGSTGQHVQAATWMCHTLN